jgi:hypothetical protein
MKTSKKGLQTVYLILSITFSMLFASINSLAAIFNVTDEMELRDALDTAAMNNEGDGIIIAGGTYNTDGSSFSYVPIATEDFPLTIVGVGEELTILDGGGVDRVLKIDADGVTEDNNSDIDISDLTIQNGNSVESGAGLFIRVGDNLVEPGDPEVTIENCKFVNNETLGGGGGADVSAPVMNLMNSTFTNNSAVNAGGGANLGLGAAVVTLTDNIFTNNTSNEEGGGASIGGGGLVALLTGNTFTDNSADEGGGADIGGGSANVTLRANTFIGNSSLSDGGGTSISGGSLITVLTNNIFVDNNADSDGGGAHIRGGGIIATLTNNTVTLNSASGVGGGLNIVLLQGTELANIFNNIVYNNTATGDGDDIFVDDDFDDNLTGSSVNLFNNDFSDFHSKCENTIGCTSNVTSADNIDADPLFINAIAGNVGISSGSPVIDAGDPAAPDLPVTDFLGNPRIIGAAPDIGAIEFTGMFQPGDANGDGVINILDVTTILNDILGISPAPGNGDCNEDGQVNILDVTCVLNIILEL